MSAHYVPVRYKRTWLHPMRISVAKSMVRSGKAIWCEHKLLGTCVRLKKAPANEKPIPKTNVIGYDKGTLFSGVTVSGNRFTANFQFNNTPRIKNRGHIKKSGDKRRGHRGLRRSRLRHRPIRIDNRTGGKLTQTTHYFLQHDKNRIKTIAEAYYCNTAVIEDVAYNHWVSTGGAGFSPIEQGKKLLYEFLRQELGLLLIVTKGHETAALRKKFFGHDPKNQDKGASDFFTHCVDSFILTRMANPRFRLHSKRVRALDRAKPIKRRDIYQDKARTFSKKEYHRYAKGGIAVPFAKKGKIRKLRTKTNETKSNHGPWTYHHSVPVACVKKFKKKYGGRIAKGGKQKAWNEEKREYQYHVTKNV